MRKLIMAVPALVPFAGTISARTVALHRDGDLRGGVDGID